MSFKEEYDALWVWYDQRFEKYEKACDEEHFSGRNKGIFDSSLDAVLKEDAQEYNRRLDALKAKYGMPWE
jgi:hypothetical protein